MLADEAETDVFAAVAQYPRVVEAAAEAHEPHRVAFYLYDLASRLPQFVEQGQRLAAITLC